MKRVKYIPILICISIFISCGGESEEHKLLHEAADVHKEALTIIEESKSNLDELKQIDNNIQIQGRSLTAEEIAFSKAVESLERRLTYWEENQVKVPGFDAEDGHDHSSHDHDHSHATEFNFPAKDLLIIQKEFKDSIKVLKDRLGVLLMKAPK